MITNDKMWMDSTEIVQSDRINQQGKINRLETIMNSSGMANIHITILYLISMKNCTAFYPW